MMSTTEPIGVGIDVSAQTLEVARHGLAGPLERFDNDRRGHAALKRWLRKLGGPVRVCMEATGVYSLDVACALQGAGDIEVMVLNPRHAFHFAQAMKRRAKADGIDARLLAEFALRMPFVPFTPPSEIALAVRQITRLAAQLADQLTAARNRLHAARATATTHAAVLAHLRDHIAQLVTHIAELEDQALALVRSDETLRQDLELLDSLPGIATRSALRLLGELAVTSVNFTPRQLVAHAGLDVVCDRSGTSVDKPGHISRRGNTYLRRTIYMPALVACQHDPHFKAFNQKLLARGKKPLQAIVAAMRKLLHAVAAVLKHKQPYDPAKLFAPS
jgi:transposase